MSNWPATKARRVLAALEQIGWGVKRQRGSHKLLTREGWPDYEFAFHDSAELAAESCPGLPGIRDCDPKIYGVRFPAPPS